MSGVSLRLRQFTRAVAGVRAGVEAGAGVDSGGGIPGPDCGGIGPPDGSVPTANIDTVTHYLLIPSSFTNSPKDRTPHQHQF